MAATLTVSCPKCKKVIKAPESLAGKKLRCKDCGTVFPVGGQPAAPSPAAKAKLDAKAEKLKARNKAQEWWDAQKRATGVAMYCDGCKKAIPKNQGFQYIALMYCEPCYDKSQAERNKTVDPRASKDDEEWGVIKSYGMDVLKDNPRCPHCAWELEDEEDIICLHCGYNLQTRQRLEEKVIHPVTGGDYVLWLLPGVACLLAALFFGGVIASLWSGVPDLEPVGLGWLQTWEWTRVYGTAICALTIFGFGRFAVKRLILHPHPPDQEKRKKKLGQPVA